MIKNIPIILKISRPRFWLYLAGPYLLGYTGAIQSAHSFLTVSFFGYLVFFLFFANIFLYGVNDYFDKDTDKFNPKKITHEHLLKKEENKKLIFFLVAALLFFLILILFSNFKVKILLSIFLFLSFFYSAPPLRFKSKPIIDFASNILYGIPALIGYALVSNSLIHWPIVLAIFFWTSAMHLFSAIPDIESDNKAGLKTSAVVFGFKISTILCFSFWSACFVIANTFTNLYPWSLLGLIYPFLAVLVYLKPKTINSVYWFFPIINAAFGFILFIKLLIF